MRYNYRVYTDENISKSTAIFAIPFSRKEDAIKYANSIPGGKKIYIEEWIFGKGWVAANIEGK